jgi:hypothetical protein
MEINGVTFTEEMIQTAAVIGIISYIIRGFYCRSIKRTLDLVREENRCMKPQHAWLALIPLFSIYWNFVIASRVADSLTNEFYDRKIAEEEDPGKRVGTLYAVFVLLMNIPLLQSFTVTAFLFAIFFFIRYWVKIENFRGLLDEHNRFLENLKTERRHENS